MAREAGRHPEGLALECFQVASWRHSAWQQGGWGQGAPGREERQQLGRGPLCTMAGGTVGKDYEAAAGILRGQGQDGMGPSELAKGGGMEKAAAFLRGNLLDGPWLLVRIIMSGITEDGEQTSSPGIQRTDRRWRCGTPGPSVVGARKLLGV